MDDEQRIFDPITAAVGNFGLWQGVSVFFIFITKCSIAWHQLAQIFLRAKPTFTCYNINTEQMTENDCSDDCIDKEIKGTNLFPETISTEFYLICDRAYLVNFSQTIVMFGILIGNFLFGIMSDKIGRKTTFIICLMIQMVFGILVAFSQYYWMFNLFRFLTAAATGGTMLIGFVLLMEILGPKYREIFGILFQIPFNIGHATLPLISYYFRPWRQYQFALSITSLIYLPYYWILPESPRWLFATGQIDKAIKVLEKGAKCNKMPLDTIKSDLELAEIARKEANKTTDNKTESLFLCILRYPVLRRKTFCVSYNWFVCGLSYYGVSEYLTDLSDNIFENVAIAGCVTIPATLCTIPMIKFLGRKSTLIITNILTAIFMLLIPVIEYFNPNLVTIFAILGIFSSFSSFVNTYVYSGELFPTVLRNGAIGMTSTMARIGGMIAPYITSSSSIAFYMPPIIYGIVPLIGALLTLLLPETRGKPWPNTIEEEELIV